MDLSVDPADTAQPDAATEVARESGTDLAVERNRQFLAAAYELLDEQGLEGLTIRAVLAKTSLSRRAFYERFVGKDDLVLAVFEETIRSAADHFEQQIGAIGAPMERLETIVTSIVIGQHVGGGREGPNRRGAALSREHLRLAEARPADLEAALKPLIAVIAKVLADGMEANVVRRGSTPQTLAALVYNLVATTTHAELLAEEANAETRPREELAREIWEFCRRAVMA